MKRHDCPAVRELRKLKGMLRAIVKAEMANGEKYCASHAAGIETALEVAALRARPPKPRKGRR